MLLGDEVRIESVVEAAKVVVVLWCNLSRDSEWVRQEALFAKSRARAVPVFVEGVELPFGFQLDHTINLADWNGAPSAQNVLEPLLRELERLSGRAQAEARRHQDRHGIPGNPARAEDEVSESNSRAEA